MSEEVKELLIKDFNEILVKEFCTDWAAKRLYIQLLVNSASFSNLLDYIQQKENIIKEVIEEMKNAKHISVDDSKAIIKHEKRILEILNKEVNND